MNDQSMNVKGPSLVMNGYNVCAIKAGEKRPREMGWQNLEMGVEKCEDWPHHADGVGVKCGVGQNPICAVDVDIEGDTAFAEHMRDFISKTVCYGPIRIGKAPKFLMMFRATEPGWKKAATAFYEKDGRRVRLEVLGKGQQFVAYHIHPDTGMPYEWPDETLGLSPEFMPAWMVPEITREQVSAIAVEFSRKATELGYTLKQDSHTQGEVTVDTNELSRCLTPQKLPVVGLTIDDARKMIKEVGFDFGPGSNDVWVKVGMALHHQFEGSDEALALWDELSAEFPEAYEEGATAKRWRSFDSKHPDAVTFRWVRSAWRKKRDPRYYETSQWGSLLRLLNRYGDRMAYIPQTGQLCAYNETTGTWSGETTEADVCYYIRHSLLEDCAEANEAFGEDSELAKAMHKFAFQNRCKLASVEASLLSMLKRTKEQELDAVALDANNEIFAVANGVIELKTGVLLPHSPTNKVRRHSDVVYDPTAKCPVWEQSIYQWVGDDPEMVTYVQRLFGNALTGAPRFDKLAILCGFGCNGKSVFNNVLTRVFGSYATVVGEETLMGKSGLGEGGRARSDIAKLNGARLVVCSETSERGYLREADVKRLTGREKITARAPYAPKDMEFYPTWQLCMATNHLPEIRGDDDGIWRRLAYIEFPRNFDKDPDVKKDIYLEDKLARELPGILNWLLKGYQDSLRDGLLIPRRVEAVLMQQRSDADLIGIWAEESLIPEAGASVWVQDCFFNFKASLESVRMSDRLPTPKMFTMSLKKKFGDAVREASQRRKKLHGYRLATADDLEDIDPFAI